METQPMYIKDCALIAIATGLKARNLSEFRDRLAVAEQGTIYYHFWCGRIRPHFESQKYSNDFSMWVDKALHDEILSERLDVIDPTAYHTIEELRQDLLEIVDVRLDEIELVPSATRVDAFHFIRSNILIFNTPHVTKQPQELLEIIPKLSHTSIFYHFIDARRRTEDNKDDFSNWLKSYGETYAKALHDLYQIDPYFVTLPDLQTKIVNTLKEHFG